jgi:hypothetical protein
VLTIHSQPRGGKTCDDISRRNCLKLGRLCVGGLTLADLLGVQARSETVRRASLKAVVMVWLEGDPSHIDTYDLKPDASAEIRGPFQPMRRKVPARTCANSRRTRKPGSDLRHVELDKRL